MLFVVLFGLLIEFINGQCTTNELSYCLSQNPTGFPLGNNEPIIGEYLYQGTTLNGCRYFKHSIHPIYLYYDFNYITSIGAWWIDNDFDSTIVYGYCLSSNLDLCNNINYPWYIFGTTQLFESKYQVYIGSCANQPTSTIQPTPTIQPSNAQTPTQRPNAQIPAITDNPTSVTPSPTKYNAPLLYLPKENTAADVYIFGIYGIIAFISVTLTLMAISHSKIGCICCKKGDNDNTKIFIFTGLRVYDLVSDIVVSIRIFTFYILFHTNNNPEILYTDDAGSEYYKNNIRPYDRLLLVLSILSVLFIIVPYTLNIIISCYMNPGSYINQTYTDIYFKFHSFKYMALVFITGDAYHSLEIINSNFLSISWFDAGMTKTDIDRKSNIKFGSIVICEDIPQAIISICFGVIQIILGVQVDKLVIFSIIVTFLSIIVSGFTLAACVINKRSISTDLFEIELKMNPPISADDSQIKLQYEQLKRYKGYKNKLKMKLCELLLLHKRDIEIGYIHINKDGLCKIFIYHTNVDINELKPKYEKKEHEICNFLKNDMFMLAINIDIKWEIRCPGKEIPLIQHQISADNDTTHVISVQNNTNTDQTNNMSAHPAFNPNYGESYVM